jgi:methylmalonyl-CoA mutase C-terminal domain/subunit
VLLAKPGLDGHDRGVKVILRALFEAGMHVIYTGMRVSPEAVVLAALQEDVDAVGLSNHSGAHRGLFAAVAEGLERAGALSDGMLLFCGGAIPPGDVDFLAQIGYRGVFPPGTALEEIVRFVREHAPAPAAPPPG